MKRCPELRPNRWDILVAAAVVALAVVCAGAFWTQSAAGGAVTAVVSMDGQEVERFPLTDPVPERTYTNHGYTLHVLLADGGLRVSEADCPTQDCVHTGTISRAGQSIVCLPARTVVQLVGGDGGDVDLVLG